MFSSSIVIWACLILSHIYDTEELLLRTEIPKINLVSKKYFIKLFLKGYGSNASSVRGMNFYKPFVFIEHPFQESLIIKIFMCSSPNSILINGNLFENKIIIHI